MTARPSQRGFTLSETLTALAIAGIGLSLAAPGLQSLATRNQGAASVNELVSTLHLARSAAVTRNALVAVCPSADGERCDGSAWDEGWIAFVDADANQERGTAETLLHRATALPDLELRSAQFEQAFTYAPNGRISGAGSPPGTGEFTFCAPGADAVHRVVVVRASGIPVLADRRRDGSTTGCNT